MAESNQPSSMEFRSQGNRPHPSTVTAGRGDAPGHLGEDVNLVTNFEESFMEVVRYIGRMDGKKANVENLHVDSDTLIENFLKEGREVEQYFLRKRLEASVNQPEVVLDEEIREIKSELFQRKALAEKHEEKLATWTKLLEEATAPTMAAPSSSSA